MSTACKGRNAKGDMSISVWDMFIPVWDMSIPVWDMSIPVWDMSVSVWDMSIPCPFRFGTCPPCSSDQLYCVTMLSGIGLCKGA